MRVLHHTQQIPEGIDNCWYSKALIAKAASWLFHRSTGFYQLGQRIPLVPSMVMTVT